MEEDRDYILDIKGLTDRQVHDQKTSLAGRPFVCVYFECCNVYSRVYRDRSGQAYVGWCPRCSRRVRIRVGPDGVSTRFFKAT